MVVEQGEARRREAEGLSTGLQGEQSLARPYTAISCGDVFNDDKVGTSRARHHRSTALHT